MQRLNPKDHLVKIVFSRYHLSMNPTLTDTLERLCNLLRSDSRRAGGEHSLLPVQFDALDYLHRCNRFSDTPMAVTEYLGQTKGTVSQTLKVLEKKGLIRKKPDTQDRRVTHLQLTDAGTALLAHIQNDLTLAHAEHTLDPAQLARLQQDLNGLLNALLTAHGRRAFGVCKTCRYHQPQSDGGGYCQLVQQYLSPADAQRICREHQQP